MDEQTARRDLIRVCHLMYERSYVVSSDGNVSVRLDDGRILATPTMTCKGRMTDDLIARMRDRVKRVRKIIHLAHDPEMIELLEQMVAEAEADIRRLEDERDA